MVHDAVVRDVAAAVHGGGAEVAAAGRDDAEAHLK